MSDVLFTDEEDNVYKLVPAPEFKKGDPTCRGCTVRAQSQVPGGNFCRSLGNYKCQEIPFTKNVWQQIKWGNYPEVRHGMSTAIYM